MKKKEVPSPLILFPVFLGNLLVVFYYIFFENKIPDAAIGVGNGILLSMIVIYLRGIV